MGEIRNIIKFIQIGVLLNAAVLMVNAERYIVTNIANQNVTDVNRVFVSTNVKTVIQCARKCLEAKCSSFSYGEKLNVYDKKCFETDSHLQYTGNWDMTATYTKCQRWDSQMPHTHGVTDAALFPDETIEDAGNYCRDPGNKGYLYCYTMDPSVPWQTCDMQKCTANHVTCNDSPTVRSYMGTWSKTESGKVCQRWDSQLPHSHSLTADMFEEETLTDAENFCRDPTGSGELWCYTTDPNTPMENCGIGNCSGVNTCQAYNDETSCEGSSKSQHYTMKP